MTAVGTTIPESDGNAVTVALIASVEQGQVAYAGGWLGVVAARDADSGDSVALSLRGEYQFQVPSSLSVAIGDIVCVDITQVTGHTPDSAAYNKSAVSSTNLTLFKATSAKDSNNVVTGILLLGV